MQKLLAVIGLALIAAGCAVNGPVVKRVTRLDVYGVPKELTFFRGERELAVTKLDKYGRITEVNGSIPDGKVLTYSPEGKIFEAADYKYGKPDGTVTLYNEDGSIAEETAYLFGKREGIDTLYKEGKVVRRNIYSEGLLDGVCKSYYLNGKVKEEDPYVDGKREGVYRSYYQNGNRESETVYKNDRQYGKTKYFDDYGFPMEQIIKDPN